MQIRIWGARGSIPTPLDSAEIEEKIVQAICRMPALDTHDVAAVRAYVHDLPPLVRGTAGGNTSCIEVRAANEIFIIDAGSGIRRLGFELLKGPCGRGQGVIHLLFSHPHWDHIQGFPFFVPAYIPGNRLILYSVHDVERALTEQQRSLTFPVPLDYLQAHRKFVRLEPGASFAVGSVHIQTLRNQHPGDSYSYRFEDERSALVCASDAEYQSLDVASIQPQLDFFRNADALIFDAQYGLRESWESKVDWGHSSVMIGVDLARRAGVKRLILFHHEPTASDSQLQEIQAIGVAYQAQDPSLPPCEVLLAYEGLQINLAPATLDVRLAPDGATAILTAGSTFDDQEIAQRLAQPGPAGPAILDLAQVERLTTIQLKQLIVASRARPGGPPVLVELSPAVQEVIRLAGYSDYFTIYPTIEAALEAVAARESLHLPGQLLAQRYQIVARLRPGHLGTVLWVTDRRQRSDAALRLLPSTLSPETLERFGAYVARLRDLVQPHIARTLDYARTPDGAAFLVEELLHGPTLDARLRQMDGPMAPGEALGIARDLTLALEEAHQHGVIHGNVTPRNVFLTPEGLKLSGFGLGRLQEGRSLQGVPVLFVAITHVAPEQILGYPLDARTDLYALGVTLYQLFTNHLPFTQSGDALLQAHLDQAPVPPHTLNPQFSPSVEHLILKLLAKHPNARYANSQQVRRVLESLLASAGAGEPSGQCPLVGRETSIATLEQIWATVLTGHGQLAFIAGEPGIGKTSLAQQVTAQHPAALVLTGACRPDSGLYHPIRMIVQAYLASVPPEFFDDAARPLLAVVAELLPELRHVVSGLEPPPALEPQQAQLRLIISIAQMIGRATRARPWCLILDDLHWVDEGSLELLRYLGRQVPDLPLLLLGTYRDTEVGPDHPLQTALRDLGRTPGYRLITLDRLNRAGVGRLLAQFWDATVPDNLVAEIAQQTGGNPLYVEEVAKGLVEDGAVVQQHGQWHYPEPTVVRLPQSVYEAVEGRIHYLNPETREVLTQAAVLGSRFRFDDLVALSGRAEWEVLEQLDLAMERQLVEEVAGERVLRFRHAEIHQMIYSDLGELRRRHLHRRAGDILEQQAGVSSEHAAVELVHHFRLAGEPMRELRYLMLAGEQAAAQYANAAALDYLSRALELAPDNDRETRWRLLLAHERVCHVLGQRVEQLADLLDLEEIADALGERWRRADAALRWSAHCEAISDYPTAADAARRALDLAEDDPARQAAARQYWGAVLWRQGDYAGAQIQFEAALDLARAVGDLQVEIAALRNLGTVAFHQGNHLLARSLYEQTLALAWEIGDRLCESRALNNLGLVARAQGDCAAAREFYAQALAVNHMIGDQMGEAMTLSNLGMVASMQGDYPAARTLLAQSLAISRVIEDQQSETTGLINLGIVLAAQGNAAAAHDLHQQALTITRVIGDRNNEAIALHELGHIMIDMGLPAAATRVLQDAVSLGSDLGHTGMLTEYRAGLARALQATGDLPAALAQVDLVLNHLATGTLDGAEAPMRAYQCCYEILRAADDERAGPLLARAHAELMAQAARMSDADRHMFLAQVPWNRAIVMARDKE
ncbi:MAG: tetratricopeptide repeat protein [Chloroflexales bacterium]